MGRKRKEYMPLKWHEDCLSSMKVFHAGLENKLKSLMADISRIEKNIEDLEKSIMIAKSKGITELPLQE